MSDLCNVLLAFARLNFRPEQEEAFFDLVRSPAHLPAPLPAGGKEGGLAGAGGRASQLEPDLTGCLGAALDRGPERLQAQEAFFGGLTSCLRLNAPETLTHWQGPCRGTTPAASTRALSPSRGRKCLPSWGHSDIPGEVVCASPSAHGGVSGKAQLNVLLSRLVPGD